MAATKFIFRKAGEAGYVEEAKSSVEFQSVEVTSALTVPAPSSNMHAATKKYVDDKAAEIRGIEEASSEQIAYSIENLRKYVDENIQGLDVKASVRAMSTSNVALAAGGRTSLSMDGVALAVGNRVLLVGQTNAAQNGIYVVGADWSLSRAADASDAGDAMPGEAAAINDVSVGMFTFVEEGTANYASGWVLSAASASPIVLGTTELTFTQFSGAGMVVAGAGLSKTGNTLDIGGSDSIQVNADSIELIYKASEALVVDANGLSVVIAEGSPITKSDGLDLTVGTGVEVASNTLDLKFDANQPFTKATGLKFEFATGLELIDDAGQKKADLKIAANQPFTKANGLEMEFASGLELVDNAGQKELDLKIDADQPFTKASGLQLEFASGLELVDNAGQKEIDLKIDADQPFSKASGLKLELDPHMAGLQLVTNAGQKQLAVQNSTTGGLWTEFDAGLAVKIGSADELSTDIDGLWVEGVPAEFKIDGTAVSANFLAGNASTLVDSKDAAALHVHSYEAMDIAKNGLDADSKKVIALDATGAVEATIEGAGATANKAFAVCYGTSEVPGATIRVVRSGMIPDFFASAPGNGPVYVKQDGSIATYANLSLPGSGSYRLVRAGFALGTSLIVDIMDLGEVVL